MNKPFFILTMVASACSVVAADKPDISKLDLSKLPPVSDQQGVTFEKDIQPLLKDSCVRCHGEDRPKAGLRLDSRDAVLKGSKDGKVIVAGDSKKSLMVIAASRIDDETAMPPKRRPGRGGPGPGGPGGGPGGPGGGPGGAGPGGFGGPGGPGGRGGFGPPPKPLTPEQVSLLRAWVDQGAN